MFQRWVIAVIYERFQSNDNELVWPVRCNFVLPVVVLVFV